MEEAFIKALKHILSKNYRYIIVADRGFGNKRFANLCQANGFEYVLRINSNFNIKLSDGTVSNLSSFDQNNIKNMNCYVSKWKENVTIDINTSNGSTWYLLKSNSNLDATGIYEKRFKIEKFFQDSKSSGFDIEKTKIKKYDRFKRLLYCVALSHMIAVMLGDFIKNNKNNIKKNSPLHIEMILALLKLDLDQFPPAIINPSTSYIG